MRSKIPAFRTTACFLAVICLTAQAAFPGFAEESGRQTVKVAVQNHTTYANQDASGGWSGLDVECMISIAQKAGFDLRFIDSTTDPDYFGGLDAGMNGHPAKPIHPKKLLVSGCGILFLTR